ncbi:BMC domain-containing protein [Bacillus massiliigorillae]|uniref:BMC domain-containing protein n=1 Tax=Bacillus massiliigorillae TaxID=1243664 RepID=UPI00039C5A03|nr:BMC domain-containing protein [Bacillus massiliigorillae]
MDHFNYSIGMIETYGFPALIAAADAAGKAADVKILTYQGADAGLVTVFIIGDVSSVQSAVAIGESEARKVGTCLYSHIIARPDENVPKMILQAMKEKKAEDQAKQKKAQVVESNEMTKKNIQELRKIASAVESFPLTTQEINSAKKDDLIKLLNDSAQKKGGEEA